MKKLLLFLLLYVITAFSLEAQTKYQVSTLAGSGVAGSDDGTGTSAQFNQPYGICIDASGNLYVTDAGNNKIRKITPGGVVSTFAGSGVAGYVDDTGNAAQFNLPYGICIDTKGNLYVADGGNNRIRKITPGGVVSTFAGSGKFRDTTSGTGTSAGISQPTSICIDAFDNLYITTENRIRKITPQAKVTTVVTMSYSPSPNTLAIDKSGNFYINKPASGGGSVHKITPGGIDSVISTQITGAMGMYVDGSGNLYVNNNAVNIEFEGNITVNKITPSRQVIAIAGSSQGDCDAVGENAQFTFLMGICGDTSGNFYLADGFANSIRKITPIVPKPPVVNYLDMPGNLCLGSGVNYKPTITSGESKLVLKMDSIPVTAPKAICKNDSLVFVVNANDSILCFNALGRLVKVYNTMPLFVNVTAIAADNQNRVYVVAPDAAYSSLTSVYRFDSAGNWDLAFGSSGSTTSGAFSNISAIALGPDGYLYAADTTNGDISIIDTSNAKVTKLAAPSASHSFYKPVGMAFGKNGQLYVADVGLNKILVRNAADNNYYDAIPGLDTLKWRVNSIDIDTNELYPNFVMSSNTSHGTVASYNPNEVMLGTSHFIDYRSQLGFYISDPAGQVNVNGSGLAPVTWVANTHGNNVKKIQVYGYIITPKLPKGLYFDFMKGNIAGTPMETVATTTYTITGYSVFGTVTKKITFGVSPSTLLSNSPGTGTSLKNQGDGLKITYTDPSNCSKMVSIDDSVGGTQLGEVQVKQTVYPTVAKFSTSDFVGRKTEIKTQDPNASARLKLYFTYKDIDNYNKFTTGAKLSNDTIGGTMQIGVLQLHTDSTGHIEEIKHNPVTAIWVHKDENWMVDFKVDKFSTFLAGGSGMIDSFSCANTGKDSVVTNKAYFWNGNTLKKSGTYTGTFVNKNGCDSVVTLKLTTTCANTGKDSIVTSNSYYIWKGDSLKTSGTYVDTFVNANGCDSVVTLKLTLNTTGIAENVSSFINVYPNPSNGLFTVNLGQNLGTVNYCITSIDGRIVRQKENINDPVTTIDLGREGSGVYFLRISNHSFIRVFRLMKQ